MPKLTIPSPSMVHYRGGRAAIDEDVYPEMDEFWADLTSAYAEQVRRLDELGCTYLQFDDTSLAYLNDPKQREMIAQQGSSDVEHLHEAYIAHINEALAGKPEGMAVTTHMCRGNFRSSWVAEGGYDFVAEALFNNLDVDGFFMEWDDARSGGFEPLRFVPKGKIVVLGLVTTKRGELESKDELKRRIEEATQYVDLDQLCLSPQCGFSSTVEGNELSREQQADKLRLIVETARGGLGRLMRSSWAPPLVAILLLLALWEAVVRAGLIPETSIPPATAAIGELATQLDEAAMWKAVGNTLQGWAIGLGLAVAARRARRDPHRLQPLGLPRAARADRVPAPDPVGGADPARRAGLRHRARRARSSSPPSRRSGRC